MTEPVVMEKAPQLEVYWRISCQWPSGQEKCEWPRQYSAEAAEGLLKMLKARNNRKGLTWAIRRHEYWLHVFDEELA